MNIILNFRKKATAVIVAKIQIYVEVSQKYDIIIVSDLLLSKVGITGYLILILGSIQF